MPNTDLCQSAENEHFELLNGGAVSQEMSFGRVAILSTQQCFCNHLKIFIAFFLWFYNNKWGDGKMKALKCNSHEFNTIETKLELGQPNRVKHSPDLCW